MPRLRRGQVNLLGPLADVPGNPVLLPGQVDDHAPDALGDIGLELHALVRVEFVDGPQEGDDSLIDNIVNLGKAAVHAPNLHGGVLDQPLVPQDQGPFQAFVPRLLVEPEELLGIHLPNFPLAVADGGGLLAHVPTALLSGRAAGSRVMFPMAWICTALVISYTPG